MCAQQHWEEMYQKDPTLLPWELPAVAREVREWQRILSPGDTSLDLGCGTGLNAVFLATNGIKVTGIDFSGTAIKIAEERAGNAGVDITWIVSDLLEVELDKMFTLVYDYSVFHHIPRTSWHAYHDLLSRTTHAGSLYAVVCYAEIHVSQARAETRVGRFGNEIQHPSRLEIVNLLSPDFDLLAYNRTRLGRRENHDAHHMLFRRR